MHDTPALPAELTLPLSEINTKRNRADTVEGVLQLDGQNFAVKVSPRGKFRLGFCRFPPLWLDFKKKELGDSILAGQNKLKLVTHCSEAMVSRGYLAAEMLAYRLLNELTDRSFRVRALAITYVDSETGKRMERPAFLIEHKKQMAARLSLTENDVDRLSTRQIDGTYAGLVNLFQYMLGNTDFSLLRGPPDDACCHNVVPLSSADGVFWTIPYDFDSTGFVNPPYGSPATELRIRRFTQRKYRGFCKHNGGLISARDEFLNKRDTLLELIQTFEDIPYLNGKRQTNFINEFYKTIENDKSFARKLTGQCREI